MTILGLESDCVHTQVPLLPPVQARTLLKSETLLHLTLLACPSLGGGQS
jgi:hypothetical protein